MVGTSAQDEQDGRRPARRRVVVYLPMEWYDSVAAWAAHDYVSLSQWIGRAAADETRRRDQRQGPG